MPQTGEIVWVEQEGRLVPFVVRAERAKTLALIGADGAEQTVADRRVVHVSDGRARPAEDGAAAAMAAAQRQAAVAAAAADVDLRTVWELVVEDGAARSLEELAELALGERSGVARDAVAVVLHGDDVFFKARKEGWVANPVRTVGELERQRARAQEETAAIERLAAGARAPAPADEAAARGDARDEALRLLEEVALHGEEAPRFGRARKVLDRLGHGSGDAAAQAFRELTRAGWFHEDEDLNLRRLRLSAELPFRAVEDAERGAAAGVAPHAGGRACRRELYTLAIDDESTTEVDDALAVETTPDGVTVHVLIADAAPFLARGTALDDEARRRGATLYHPVRRYLMLPPVLSEGVASLAPGEDRLALDFAITLGEGGDVRRFTVEPALTRVDRRITYEQVDALLAVDEAAVSAADRPAWEVLRSLLAQADAFQAWRRARGALLFERREHVVRVLPDGRIVLKVWQTGTPAQRLVSEMMILAGFQAGAWCRDHGIPAVYRRQAPADEPLGWDETKAKDRIAIEETLRQLKRAELTLRPDAHATLGIDVYTQVTSPLRRYQDLVMHRQLHAHLRGEKPPYGDEELMAIFAEVEETAAAHARVERDAKRYWTLKLMAQSGVTEVDAIVLREVGRRVVVELMDWGITAQIGAGGTPGDRIRLRVGRIAPREDRLVLNE